MEGAIATATAIRIVIAVDQRKALRYLLKNMKTSEQIWQEFHQKLLNFIKVRINNSLDAEDILHDIFIKIENDLDKLKTIKNLENWVYRITRNTIIDYYRTKKEYFELPEWLESTTESFESIDISSCIEGLITKLPKIYQTAIQKAEIEGLSQKELARIENISISGAKSRIQRGRLLLKEILHDCCKIEIKADLFACGCHSKENHC